MQVDTRRNDHQLCAVLHVIATQPEPKPCITFILQRALDLTDAVGAVFQSANDPLLDVAIGENDPNGTNELDFASLTNQSDTLQFLSSEHVLAASVQHYGIFALTFPHAHQLDDSERELIESLADSLAIVAARAEADALREQQRSIALSGVYSITDPLLIFDDDKRLMLANPAAQALFGDRAAVGGTLADVVESEALLAFVAGERPLNEWTSGEKTFVPRVQSILDEGEEANGLILTLRDITQYKALNRNQHEFIRIVSHDIRSPMTSIQGFASMLGMVGELNERQEHFVEKVLSGIAQITALVENIQDAGRFDPETGFYEMNRVQVDLDELATRIVDNHLIPAEKQELSVLVNVADDVPIINADMTMLERALTNLIDNAIKYTPNGSEINVNVGVKNNSVLIGVHDNGLGISPENQKMLFQRHVRIARKEHRKIKGSGLGLFIVKSVAQRHGGDAWVESVEGQGSTFFIGIPLEGQNLVISGGA